MRATWRTVALSDVCSIDKTKHDGDAVPYVGMEHIESGTGRLCVAPTPLAVKSATFRFSDRHVLYGRLRPYLNKVLLPDFTGHCSTEIFPLRCNEQLDRGFLFYWLTSSRTVQRIDGTSTGARMPRANVSAVLGFDFPLPPLREQKRIVAVLDATFAAIDKVAANAETSRANARELFESQLQRLVQGRPSNGSDVVPWDRRRLADVASEIIDRRGVTPKKLGSCFLEAGHRVISAMNVAGRAIDVTRGKSRYVDTATYKKWMKVPLRSDDVILTSEAPLGEPAYVAQDVAWCLGQRLFGIRTDKSKCSGRFLYYALQSRVVRDDLMSRATGATALGIRQAELKKVLVPTPPLPLQESIVVTLDQLSSQRDALVERYSTKIRTLSHLRQSLLHAAFTGELTGDRAAIGRALSETGS